ncbi:hypothetical protein [Halopiger goleimassiliensis]|uniref:hypothetical protein n=1 Tax=Halopiger goleimassiliensis TaxID=1293048 RepID=UPI000677EE61|nr:hypothetical protein [Halopiger goleimassiliensis]
MQLEQGPRSAEADWSGTVPNAFDGRVLGFVVVIAGLAASLNVPYGGIPFAAVAFVVLAVLGVVAHVLGERQLRRITDGLVERWVEAGGHVEDVTRSDSGMRTEWTVHTPDGDVTIGGIALVPISRVSIEWQGVTDSMDASEADENIDALAASLYEELFEIGPATRRR